ncbi:alpha-glucosidase [Paraflavitalea soli]|uniref:Alpha-glucosidase n=1 Tax=Paraflavitalea soli TaxID=2315862 RepID=A0A3B7MEF3_9BACT|nr:alpha-glucosidase [Paraflavitalea soli]AXY72718.1 alpha-glucosidase [Paraflavitalea soli]
MEIKDKDWWKETVIYQVYPRSFKDSNGDGIGDLPGLVSKLDYIESLGVGLVWLNPVYASPNDDNGYDISNYEAIQPVFGTIADLNALLTGLHARGIKLLMDLVVNHTSDEHPWFVESRKSRDNPYRDYYHWWPAEKGKPPRRHSFFDPAGDAWQYDAATDAYYLHYFSRKQPDLNWENPTLRKEIYGMMRFWLDKGIDGFRLDAVSYIAKDTNWPVVSEEELKEKYHNDWSYVFSHGPKLHDYLHEMNREVLQHYEAVTIAETPGIEKKEALAFVHEDRQELSMLYHFEGMGIGYVKDAFKRPDPAGYRLSTFKQLYSDWDKVFAEEGWGTIYLGNHDQPRMLSRWGNDAPEYRLASAKMLMTFLLTMRATPIFYNGDELGMANIKFERIHDYRDIETLSMYQYLQSQGEDLEQFLRDQQYGARDNGRTPFQWDATPQAGFTTGEPWIPVNADHVYINAAAQEADGNSPLNYFRRLTQLRKEHLALVYGRYQLYDAAHEQVYTYTRVLEDAGMAVILNFSKELVNYILPAGIRLKKEEPVINNETSLQLNGEELVLLPYQAVVFELALS